MFTRTNAELTESKWPMFLHLQFEVKRLHYSIGAIHIPAHTLRYIYMYYQLSVGCSACIVSAESERDKVDLRRSLWCNIQQQAKRFELTPPAASVTPRVVKTEPRFRISRILGLASGTVTMGGFGSRLTFTKHTLTPLRGNRAPSCAKMRSWNVTKTT